MLVLTSPFLEQWDPPIWTVQVNDLVGGWVVTDWPHPVSEHNFQDPAGCGIIAAECCTKAYAVLIAKLLNQKLGATRWSI